MRVLRGLKGVLEVLATFGLDVRLDEDLIIVGIDNVSAHVVLLGLGPQ